MGRVWKLLVIASLSDEVFYLFLAKFLQMIVNREVTSMVDVARNPFPGSMSSTTGPDLEHWAGHLVDNMREYAREKPVSFAAWTFAVGFIVGWRLKPW